jgi:hypothetical protein
MSPTQTTMGGMAMGKFGMTGKDLREVVQIGQTVKISTSGWGCETEWRPDYYAHHAVVRALLKSGDFEGRTFWRGAEIIRVR